MTTEEAKVRIGVDPDWIYSKRFGYSLRQILERYPDGCSDRIIAAVLMITEDDVSEQYKIIVEKLRKILVDDSLSISQEDVDEQ